MVNDKDFKILFFLPGFKDLNIATLQNVYVDHNKLEPESDSG